MTDAGRSILASLSEVAHERRARQVDPALGAGVEALKRYQHARFAATYADLLASPRHGAAARFFLDDLYGPWDFAQRDAQFARIVPALVRLFSSEIVETVSRLAALHALSEQLDSAMAAAVGASPLDDTAYAQAWRQVGRAEARTSQIALMHQVGAALDRYTRKPGLLRTLRLMRLPARAAGLQALHVFLERGFETFRGMRGAQEFLGTISEREARLAEALFAADAVSRAGREGLVALATGRLGELPW